MINFPVTLFFERDVPIHPWEFLNRSYLVCKFNAVDKTISLISIKKKNDLCIKLLFFFSDNMVWCNNTAQLQTKSEIARSPPSPLFLSRSK